MSSDVYSAKWRVLTTVVIHVFQQCINIKRVAIGYRSARRHRISDSLNAFLDDSHKWRITLQLPNAGPISVTHATFRHMSHVIKFITTIISSQV